METFAQDDYDYTDPLYNAQGQLHGLQKYTRGKNTLYEHLYKDGVIQEAVNYKVSIQGQTPVKGIYKEGVPFEGYFLEAEDEMELYLVNYYEKGQLLAQYSRPLMVITEEGDMYIDEGVDDDYDYGSEKEQVIKLTVKTTYENGRAKDGVSYQFHKLGDGAFVLAMETYENSKRKYVDLLLGAIHYAEHARLTFLKDGYTLTTKENEPLGRAGGTLTVRWANQAGTVTLTPNSSFAFHKAPLSQPLTAQWGHVYYYKQGDAYYYQHTTNIQLNQDHYSSSNGMIHVIFAGLMQDAAFLSPTDANNYADLFATYHSYEFQAQLFLMKNGVPHTGTRIEPGSKPNTYSYTKYQELKVLESQKNITSEQLDQLKETRH